MIDPERIRTRFLTSLRAVRAAKDGDHVHRLRTSAARLKTWLELADERALVDDLAWVRDRAAPVREIDVARKRPAPPALKSWLVAQSVRREAALRRALDDPRIEALCRALAPLRPIRKRDAKARLARFEERVRRRGALLTKKATITRFHRVRRALRRLRNANEWLGVDCKDLEKALDAFGSLNDTSSLLDLARKCPARVELAGLRRELRKQLDTERLRAFKAWQSLERRRGFCR